MVPDASADDERSSDPDTSTDEERSPEPDTSTDEERSSEPDTSTDEERSAVIDALIGGIAGVILSFIPLSPVLGGAVAGYLQNDTREGGLKVGAGAGLIMLLPYAFIGFFLMLLLGLGGTPAAFGVLALFVLVMASLYTVGLSALGGYLGVYVRQEL